MHSPYPIRLDTPPPQSHFRRPWSPQELEPLGTSRARIERQETSESYEALDLADYATTLHRTNVQSSFREPGPYPPFSSPGRQYLEYPATPPRSFSFASRGSYPSPPSLVSAGSSSAQTHSRSTRSHVPQHRPFSLPAPTPHYPYTPPGSNSGHSHNYPRIFEAQSPALPHEPRVDLSAFPEWSREWYDRPKTQMPGGFEPYDSFNTYDVDYPSQSHDGLLGFPAKQHSVTNDSHRSLLPWSGEDDASHTHVTSEMKEERLRMLEKEFGHNGIDSSVIDQAKVIGSVDAKGNIITDGPKKRIITRYVQFTFVLGTTIASLYSALILKPEGTPPPKGTIPAYLLYVLSVISLLAILFIFVFAPCCCSGQRRQKVAQEGPAGMMVLPIQGLPGTAPKKGRKKDKGKKDKHGNSGEGVQVNLIVDPSAFGLGGRREEDGTEQEEDGSVGQRPKGKRKGLFEGLAMEHQWKLARKHLKKIMFFDIAMFFLWGAEFIVILMGKRCPVGAFAGWCDGYNVATALAAFIVITYGLSIFFDIKDIHASRASPRTRT